MADLETEGGSPLETEGGVTLETEGTPPVPITFSGTVPDQAVTVNVPFNLDLSAYFSGTETPFSYAIQAGSLPTGLSLNTSSGVISGTPTVVEAESGLVIRGTDQTPDTADTNAFEIAIYAVLAIDTQPTAQVVTQGDTATFTGAVSGGIPPVSVQWYEDGSWIIGGQGFPLEVLGELWRDGALYKFIATDGDGNTVESNEVSLTVNPASTLAPVIQGPQNVTVQEGGEAIFRIKVFGTGPFTITWEVAGGGVIFGADSEELRFVAYSQNDGAYYQATVRDVSGLVTQSQVAQLTVVPSGRQVEGTAGVSYPCALPGVLVANNRYRSKQRTRRNDLASGPPLFILEDDGGYEVFEVAWSFDALQVQAFRNWYRCDTISGAMRFNIPLMVDGADVRGGVQTLVHECYFDGVPEYTQVGRRWRVSAALIAIEEQGLDCCDNLPELYDWFGGDPHEIITTFNDIFPPTPPTPQEFIPPECLSYDCAAFVKAAAALGYEAVDFLDFQGPSVLPEYLTLYEGGASNIRVGPDYLANVGDAMPAPPFSAFWTIESGDIDQCAGKVRGVDVPAQLNSPGGANPTKFTIPGRAFAFLHKGNLFDGWSSISSLLDIRCSYDYVTSGGSGSQTLDLEIDWNPPLYNTGNFRWGAGMVSGDFGEPSYGSTVNFTSVAIAVGTPYKVVDGATNRWYVPITYTVRAAGDLFTHNRNHQFFAAGGAEISNFTVGGGGLFNGAGAQLFALVHSISLDIDALYLAYRRNFADYEVPPECEIYY